MTGLLVWLGSWFNAPFVLAAFVGFLLSILSILGGGHDHDVQVHGIDVDGDGHPDIFTHDHDADGFSVKFLVWVGLGKVPLAIILQSFLATFGLTGLLLNAIAHDVWGWLDIIVFPISMVVGLVTALYTTRGLVNLIANFAPQQGSITPKTGDFIGVLGTTVSLVTPVTGQVKIPSSKPNLPPQYVTVVSEGNIPRDTEVLVTEYDSKRSVYVVTTVSSKR